MKPWAGLFNENRSLAKGIKLSKKLNVKENGRVVLGENHVMKLEDAWGFSLLGYIIGRFPGRAAIETVCES